MPETTPGWVTAGSETVQYLQSMVSALALIRLIPATTGRLSG